MGLLLASLGCTAAGFWLKATGGQSPAGTGFLAAGLLLAGTGWLACWKWRDRW
jgi:hypothetical protein